MEFDLLLFMVLLHALPAIWRVAWSKHNIYCSIRLSGGENYLTFDL